ncbi:DUF6642 family protein [Nocardioides sp.]|uniref:DUF6642 family protein n=1 Tax=Nocardioides sp. TaxID=35761 RepID=UPI0035B05D28
MKLPGIFCLEGEWDDDLRRRRSVLPILELFERLGIARYVHRDVATREELAYYLKRWRLKSYQDYQLLYLAMHGDIGELDLGRDTLRLPDLAELIRGKAAGRTIYFGSCWTMLEDEAELQRFVRTTGATAAVGFSEEVDWLESAGFEVFLIQKLLQGRRSDAFFASITREHPALVGKLGLTVATKTKTYY